MSEVNMPPKKKKTINSDRSISEQHKNVSNTPKTSVDKSKPVKKQASTKPITGEQNAKFYTKPQPEATMQKLNKNENVLVIDFKFCTKSFISLDWDNLSSTYFKTYCLI